MNQIGCIRLGTDQHIMGCAHLCSINDEGARRKGNSSQHQRYGKRGTKRKNDVKKWGWYSGRRRAWPNQLMFESFWLRASLVQQDHAQTSCICHAFAFEFECASFLLALPRIAQLELHKMSLRLPAFPLLTSANLACPSLFRLHISCAFMSYPLPFLFLLSFAILCCFSLLSHDSGV